MNSLELESSQSSLHARIRARAAELNYNPDTIKPICDGVVDWAGYLSAPLKVCWVLKEPYDDKDGNGNPAGGGWTMFKDFVREGRLAETVNANPALRNVAYASWALLSGVSRHADIPKIPDDPAVAESLLRVCYLNTGKMPAATITSRGQLLKIHREWRDIVLEQIELADPDLLIFGGTLDVWAADFGIDLAHPLAHGRNGGSVVDVHSWRGKRVLYAEHPATHKPPKEWIDALLAAAVA
jgi:hypothetical protein